MDRISLQGRGKVPLPTREEETGKMPETPADQGLWNFADDADTPYRRQGHTAEYLSIDPMTGNPYRGGERLYCYKCEKRITSHTEVMAHRIV